MEDRNQLAASGGLEVTVQSLEALLAVQLSRSTSSQWARRVPSQRPCATSGAWTVVESADSPEANCAEPHAEVRLTQKSCHVSPKLFLHLRTRVNVRLTKRFPLDRLHSNSLQRLLNKLLGSSLNY